MALQSPGIQISINDQSQYVNSNIGSVPFVVLATAQDKTYNGNPASGTSKANAGKLLSFTSQRDLVNTMGIPKFQFSAANTPINGSELNEYGLLAAYSALGISNQLYAIRADIDLAQLTGTSNRPFSNPADGTYWLDLANTQWGIYELNSTQDGFDPINPLLITDPNQVINDSAFGYPVPTPKNSVGTVGSYALVFVGTDGKTPSAIRLFYKADAYAISSLRNKWVEVGSTSWRQTIPVVTSTANQPLATNAAGNLYMVVGGGTTQRSITITLSGGDSMTSLKNAINSAANAYGVYAEINSSNYLQLYVSNAPEHIESTGEASPAMRLFGGGTGANNTWENFGLKTSQLTYYVAPGFAYRTYANLPQWLITDPQPHAPGSVLWKISDVGGGYSPSLKKYNASLDKWVTETVPFFVPLTPNTNSLPVLNNVRVVDNAGNFQVNPTATPMSVGQQVLVSGTDTGSVLDGSYSSTSPYYIITTDGHTTFTLSLTRGGAAITTVGPNNTTGLTFQLGSNVQSYDQIYYGYSTAIYGLDPNGGGSNIGAGNIVATKGAIDGTSNELVFSTTTASGATKATGGQLASASPFTATNAYHILSTKPGDYLLTDTKVTLSGSNPDSFVTDSLNALASISTGNPYVSVVYNPTDGPHGSITFIHSAGGEIVLVNDGSSQVLSAAKFATNAGGSGYNVNSLNGYVLISNFKSINTSLVCSSSAPYTAPADGTLWYYSNEADVDIMINDNGWKGYQNVSSDARGYNLSSTDKNGVIINAGVAPTSQYNGNSLVAGDLWLDSADLVNYPKLYRYNGASWVAINTADQITSSGILFADARWDTTGTTDVISGKLPTISDGVGSGLLFSNYLDEDAPDYRLYPRGMLLFNTRRSGYNVKKFIKNYFNPTTFSTPGNIPGTSNSLPQVTDAWVTASGLKNDGSMYAGSAAQRAMIVGAMKSAIDSNLQIREDIYNFNLLCVPAYPEVIPNLVSLNNGRSNTGFIIGDTPLTLAPDTVSLSQWVNNTNSTGLPATASSDAYTAIYYPSGLANDLSGNTVVVPASHAVLRTFLYNDNISYPWFAPAGVTRGLVSNLNDIGYIDANTGRFIHNGINQGLRDALYSLKINPITQLPGTGLVVWGQKTRLGSTTSRSNVNVVRLENYLRTVFQSISNGYLFQPNDTVTRKSIASQIEGTLHDVLAKRGLYDFLVICDSSNNTSSTIANNQLYVDVAIEPARDVEFIYIPIALYNPGTITTLTKA
jgi:Phage tail sheath C-terminal domain/Flagellin hook IN motif